MTGFYHVFQQLCEKQCLLIHAFFHSGHTYLINSLQFNVSEGWRVDAPHPIVHNGYTHVVTNASNHGFTVVNEFNFRSESLRFTIGRKHPGDHLSHNLPRGKELLVAKIRWIYVRSSGMLIRRRINQKLLSCRHRILIQFIKIRQRILHCKSNLYIVGKKKCC